MYEDVFLSKTLFHLKEQESFKKYIIYIILVGSSVRPNVRTSVCLIVNLGILVESSYLLQTFHQDFFILSNISDKDIPLFYKLINNIVIFKCYTHKGCHFMYFHVLINRKSLFIRLFKCYYPLLIKICNGILMKQFIIFQYYYI